MKSLSLSTTVLVALLTHSLYASEGAGSSGGGSIVFLKSGEPLVTDLYSGEELLSLSSAQKKFDDLHPRFVKSVAQKSGFFMTEINRCAQDHLIKALGQSFAGSLEANIYRFNVPLPRPSEATGLSLPAINEVSSIVDVSYQFPVARYFNTYLDLDGPLFDRLSEDSKCALGIHENLRVLNLRSLRNALTTSEIEEYTRFLLSYPARNQRTLELAQGKLESAAQALETLPKLEKVQRDLAALKLGRQQKKLQEIKDLVTNLETLVGVANGLDKKFLIVLTEAQDRVAELQFEVSPSEAERLRAIRSQLVTCNWAAFFGPTNDSDYVHPGTKELKALEDLGTFKWYDRREGKVVKRVLP